MESNTKGRKGQQADWTEKMHSSQLPVHGFSETMSFDSRCFEDLVGSVLASGETESGGDFGYLHAALHVLFVSEDCKNCVAQLFFLQKYTNFG